MSTRISWTNETWNPVTGCTPVSEGCKNCYAERMSKRLAGRCGYPAGDHAFDVHVHMNRMWDPLGWKNPRMVFVCSMGDLFHKRVPDHTRDMVFTVMAGSRRHTFQVLTKRPEIMAEWISKSAFAGENFPSNVWLGVSVESRATLAHRVGQLSGIENVSVRFMSAEPLLESLDEIDLHIDSLDWIIAGCESINARPGTSERGMVP